MPYYLNKTILSYIFFIIIKLNKGTINKEFEINNLFNNKLQKTEFSPVRWINGDGDFHLKNIIDSKKNELSLNVNEYHNLNFTYNLIELNNSNLFFFLDLKGIEKEGKELLLYTNITNDLIYNLSGNTGNITIFHIFSNDDINNDAIYFEIHQKKKNGKGFLDFLLINKGEFILNNNITRELLYNKNYKKIILNKDESKTLYYINFIPNDNNSNLYYLQFSYDSSTSKKEKSKIQLYYLNEFKNDRIEGIINNIKKKKIKRDKKINGKIEIFAVEYKYLNNNINLNLNYNRIKGDGIIGYIVTLSILFGILFITVAIFLKNTYCGNIKRSSLYEKRGD